jgi:hypothetical protein
MYTLGHMYSTHPVLKDATLGEDWMTRAADQRHPEAVAAIAMLHLSIAMEGIEAGNQHVELNEVEGGLLGMFCVARLFVVCCTAVCGAGCLLSPSLSYRCYPAYLLLVISSSSSSPLPTHQL